jgi:hypothetical protein
MNGITFQCFNQPFQVGAKRFEKFFVRFDFGSTLDFWRIFTYFLNEFPAVRCYIGGKLSRELLQNALFCSMPGAGPNLSSRNTPCMDVCPGENFIGVVNPAEAGTPSLNLNEIEQPPKVSKDPKTRGTHAKEKRKVHQF